MQKWILMVLLLVMTVSSAMSADETIVVAAFEYPPIYQNAQDKGLSGDMVAAAFKAVNVDVEMQFFPVARVPLTVAKGKAVCGIGGIVLFDTPETRSDVTNGGIIQYVSQTFLYNSKQYPNGIVYNSLDEMAKYKIGVLMNSGIQRFLEKNSSLEFIANTIHDGSAKQLESKRIDVWAIVDLTGMMYMKQLFPDKADDYKYTKSFTKGDVSIFFSNKADPDKVYMTKFKEGLAIIKKDGTYMQIMAKYYGGKDLINKDALTDDMK